MQPPPWPTLWLSRGQEKEGEEEEKEEDKKEQEREEGKGMRSRNYDRKINIIP